MIKLLLFFVSISFLTACQNIKGDFSDNKCLNDKVCSGNLNYTRSVSDYNKHIERVISK